MATSLPLFSPARDQETVPRPPGVDITISADPQNATVGDHIKIDLDIRLPRGYEAFLPDLGDRIGDFAVVQVFPGPGVPEDPAAAGPSPEKGENPAAASHYLHRSRIVVALYRTGEFEFPSLAVTLRDPDGRELSVSTPSAQVVITSVVTEQDPALKDLKLQAEIPEPFRWLMWIVPFLVLILLALVVWWLRRRKGRAATALPAAPQIDPLDRAEAALRALLERKWLEEGKVKPFYVAIAEIVKEILEAGSGIHTLEKTTAEILGELRSRAGEGTWNLDLEMIEDFLLGCDLVKFAKHIPSRLENEKTVKTAEKILQDIRKMRAERTAPAPVTVGGTS